MKNPLIGLSTFINHSAWLTVYAMDAIVIVGANIPMVRISAEALPSGCNNGLIVTFLLSLLWLHYKPERLATLAICLPVIIMLSGIGVAVMISP